MIRRYIVARQKGKAGYRWLVVDLQQKHRADRQEPIVCRSRSEARRRAAELNVTFNLPPQDLRAPAQ